MKSLSVNAAAQELGVSAGTVYGLCARHEIRHQRIGLGRGTIRIPEDAIEEYRQSVTVTAEGGESLPPGTHCETSLTLAPRPHDLFTKVFPPLL
jgi:excisionase family DNA binding protein